LKILRDFARLDFEPFAVIQPVLLLLVIHRWDMANHPRGRSMFSVKSAGLSLVNFPFIVNTVSQAGLLRRDRLV